MGSKRAHRFNALAMPERGGLAKRVVEYQRGELLVSGEHQNERLGVIIS